MRLAFNRRLELLPREGVEAIKENALKILEEVGFAYRHKGALKMLEEHGAIVDYSREVAKLPGGLVLDCLKKAPKQYIVEPPQGDAVCFGDGSIKATMGLEIQFVDYGKMERRPGRTEDCVKSITVGNELGNVGVVSPFVVPSDVPVRMADVREHRLLFTYSRKPFYAWIYSVESCKYILDMAKAVAGGEDELRRKKIVGYGAEPTSPLQLSRHAIEILMEMAEYGLPISASGSMSLLGGTAPVTIAGALSLHAAEVLAGIVLVNLINPDSPVGFSTSIHVLDQRTAICSFGAPENTLASLAGIQVARELGLSCFANVALTDSNTPDFQAGFEKASSSALVLAAGAEGIGQQGIVGADQGASLEQLVIDNEWFNYVNRILKGFEVNQETLALEVIKRIGVGGSFLKEQHTLRKMREELWYPSLFNRDDWIGWEKKGCLDLLKRSRAVLERIIREHYPPEPVIDEQVINRLSEIEAKAAKDLAG
ncbi:MAG: trimethylamine methyltransferase family protein [Candidatus Brockarchaeota archaeon]|nr:trimethylamine methyltransferase family protein [Candidatus Brockarchaeota archaeon]MBO3809023.1 trimethylamine methyltransferase family protein [Candidatus Brockarchaeota archaeon]